MATVRQRILELHGMGYSPDECYRELHHLSRTVSKAYVLAVLDKHTAKATQNRRIELTYELCLEINTRLKMLTEVLNPETVQKAMARLELRQASKTVKPLPEEHPTESAG